MSDTYFPTSRTLLASYDHDSCSWRTCTDICLWGEQPLLPRLPDWGMTHGGELFERPTPARLTDARGCSSSRLLPTSRATDGEKGGPGQVNGRGVADSLPGRQKASDGRSAPHGKSLSVEALRLLPTPTAQDAASSSGANPAWGHGITITDAARNTVQDWGIYTAAIRRGETFIGRPAPDPTEPDTNGKPRLSRRFDEWLMGLPEGWVTDCGIPYGAQLKALGNGVVPQQAALALRMLLGGDA